MLGGSCCRRRDGERTELRKGGKERGKGSCAEAQVLCLVAADNVRGGPQTGPPFAAIPTTACGERGRGHGTATLPQAPSPTVLFGDRHTRRRPPFLVGCLVEATTTTAAAAATATSNCRTTDRPTSAAPQSSTAKGEGRENRWRGEKNTTPSASDLFHSSRFLPF